MIISFLFCIKCDAAFFQSVFLGQPGIVFIEVFSKSFVERLLIRESFKHMKPVIDRHAVFVQHPDHVSKRVIRLAFDFHVFSVF